MQQRAVFRNCTSVCDLEGMLVLDIFFDCILLTIEIIGLFIIADVFFERKFKRIKSMLFVIAGYVFCFQLLGQFLNLIGTTTIKSIIVVITFYFLIILLYQGRKIRQLFFVAMFYILLYTIDYLVIAGSLLFLQIDISVLYNSQYAYVVAALLAKSILLYSCIMFSKKIEASRRHEKFSILEWGQLLIVPICMILNLTIVVYDLIQNNNLTFVLFLDIGLLLLGTFIYAYLETELEKKKQVEIQNLILTKQIQAEEKQAELVRNHLQEQRKLTHDFQNHLYTLRGLLQNKNHTEEALEYIQKLTGKNESGIQIVHTKNAVIDALLNQKYDVCKRERIPIFFEVSDLQKLHLSQEKNVVILSNILDNAIESCRKQNTGRYIKVKFLMDDLGTILSVQNTASLKKSSNLETFTSTKENQILHGYGLKNALHTVEDSGGMGEVSCENGVFQFTAIWN